jgi:hypothetical protein
VRGEHPTTAPAAATDNGNAPFSSSAKATVITTFNVQPPKQRSGSLVLRDLLQCPVSAQSNVSDTRSISVSTAATLVESERSVYDPFSTTTSSTGRAPSLCTRFSDLDLSNVSAATAEEDQGKSTMVGVYKDHLLMPPPPLPKQIKHASSLPVLSATKSSHSPVLQKANTSMRRSPTAASDSFDTPTKSHLRRSPKKTPKTPLQVFYSKDALTPLPAWSQENIHRRVRGFDDMVSLMQKQMEGTTFNQQFLKDTIESQRDQRK